MNENFAECHVFHRFDNDKHFTEERELSYDQTIHKNNKTKFACAKFRTHFMHSVIIRFII